MGDLVLSCISQSFEKVVAVHKTEINLDELEPTNEPFLISKNFFGTNSPNKDLLISGHHQLIFFNPDHKALGIHSFRALPSSMCLGKDFKKIKAFTNSDKIFYYHLELASGKDGFYANNIAVESFVEE